MERLLKKVEEPQPEPVVQPVAQQVTNEPVFKLFVEELKDFDKEMFNFDYEVC